MNTKKWLPIAAGVGVGAVGLYLWERHASASSAVPAPPATSQVALQPGETTVSVARGGSVMLTLPTSATWASSNALAPMNPTTVQPSGNTAYNVVMGQTPGVYPLTASWLDSSGNAKSTLIHIAVS